MSESTFWTVSLLLIVLSVVVQFSMLALTAIVLRCKKGSRVPPCPPW